MCTQTHNLLVTHHQDLELLDIVHQELLEAGGQHVLGLLVATITDIGHQHLTLEPPADPVVNTSGLTPVFLLGDIQKDIQALISCRSNPANNTTSSMLCRLTAILTYLSDWWRMNFLVLFLTILGFVRGLRAAMVTEDRKVTTRLA